MKLDFVIDGNNFDMAGEASSSVKRSLAKLGVSPPVVKRAAIAMYEAEINAFIHGGWSTASEQVRKMGFGAGMGLPNIKKNTDELDITTAPGEGTEVKMVIYIK